MVVPLFRRCVLLLSLCSWAAAQIQPASGPASAPTSQAATQPTTQPQNQFRGDISKAIGQIDGVSSAVDEIDGLLANNLSIATLRDQLQEQTSKIDTGVLENNRVLQRGVSLDTLQTLYNTWTARETELLDDNERLRRLDDQLNAPANRLADFQVQWSTYRQEATAAADTVAQRFDSLLHRIEALQKQISSRQAELLDLQNGFSVQSQRVQSVIQKIEDERRLAYTSLFEQDNPPIWNLRAAAGMQRQLEDDARSSLRTQWDNTIDYFSRQQTRMVLHLLLVGALAWAANWMRRKSEAWIQSEPPLETSLRILRLPFSTGYAFSLLWVGQIYVGAPRLFWAMLLTASLLPVYRVLRLLIQPMGLPMLRGLIVVWTVNQSLTILDSLPLLSRFTLLLEAAGAAAYFGYLGRFVLSKREIAPDDWQWMRRFLRTVARFVSLVFLGSFVADVLGYVSLARVMSNSLMTAGYIAMSLSAGMRVATALIIGALHVFPVNRLHAVSDNRPVVHKRLKQVMAVVGVTIWIMITSRVLAVRPLLNEWANAVFDTPLPRTSLTLGMVTTFAITVTAAFLLSRFVRFILREDVYPHVSLARGVPYAISTVLHYSILLAGFLLALNTLQISISQFAVLAGAFGVGVGFGLQSIFNNFFSGLILLFERPIQVGDVVELDGGLVGTVANIGIRASIVRTLESAEIIVPNSLLISNRVINWTFSSRQRGFSVVYSVATGSDVKRVTQLLLEAAKTVRLIAVSPAPQVFLSEVTVGVGPKFELRAWTNQFDDWLRARSELNAAVVDALTREGVTLK